MYICVCKCLTDRDIRQGVFRGDVVCMDTLRDCLGASTGCGSCASAARACLEDALAHKSLFDAAPGDTSSYDPPETRTDSRPGTPELSPA